MRHKLSRAGTLFNCITGCSLTLPSKRRTVRLRPPEDYPVQARKLIVGLESTYRSSCLLKQEYREHGSMGESASKANWLGWWGVESVHQQLLTVVLQVVHSFRTVGQMYTVNKEIDSESCKLSTTDACPPFVDRRGDAKDPGNTRRLLE